MSTVSDDGGLDDAELQLGLGLGISGSGNKAMMVETRNMASSSSSGCSSASSSSLDRADADAGVKRIADFSADSAGVNLVVGWPPVRAYRISTMGNRINLASKPEFDLNLRTSESGGPLINNLIKGCGNKDGAPEKERGTISPYVKVNMDGYPIGRKVDLGSFNCYETLARTLEGMFVNFQQSTSVSIGSDREKNMTRETRHPASKLLIGSSEFVLTYEDKDGDWMLVGDVPWRMFCNSVKRLRITRTSDANVPDM